MIADETINMRESTYIQLNPMVNFCRNKIIRPPIIVIEFIKQISYNRIHVNARSTNSFIKQIYKESSTVQFNVVFTI